MKQKNNSDEKAFFAEGMRTYKEASDILVFFGKGIESRLQAVLNERSDWGQIVPVAEARAKSTTYWSMYPLLNAKRLVTWKGKEMQVSLAVNWYQADGNYPFYSVELGKDEAALLGFCEQDMPHGIEVVENHLRLYPDPNDFDLERDCNRLLDVLVDLTR